MKLLVWVLPAVGLVLVILVATGVAPVSLGYTVVPGLAVAAILVNSMVGSRTERR